MATQPDDEDEPLELTEELEPDDESEEQREDEENPEVNDEEDEQPIVAFEGEEPEPEPDNSVIRTMRQELRETKRRLAEAEKAAAPKLVEIGPKPSLWDEGIDGDEDKYDQAIDGWRQRKDAADRQQQAQAEQSRKVNEDWQNDLQAFDQKRAALTFEDADEAIENAKSALDLVQQAVIVKAAVDPALFLYALSKSPTKAAELAKIQDPIKLGAAVARMEGAVKVTKGRRAPEPDKPLRGSAQMPNGKGDAKLEKLEKEAGKPGADRTELIRYRKQLREAGKL